MSVFPFQSKRRQTIEHEAADWVVKRERGLTQKEQDAFSQWLAADPIHPRQFAQQRHSWRVLDQLADWRPEHAQRPNRDLLAPHRPAPRWARGPKWLGLAAAAALILALSWWARPGATTDVLAAGIERHELEDGSVVDLNRGAAIRVDYDSGGRRVSLLRGEAHFTVAKNPARPFVVTARGIDVQAVGTAFHVRIDPAEVKVLVTEGEVRIESAPRAANAGGGGRARTRAPLISAGELAVVPLRRSALASQITTVSQSEIERMLAWKPRMLDFNGASLRAVVAEFNRCNDLQLVIADPELEVLELTLSFRSDNVAGFVRLLEGAFGIRAARTAEAIILERAD